MKVCDVHQDTKAIDSIVIEREAVHFDVCKECRDKVMRFFSKEPDESPVTTAKADVEQKAPKRGFSIFKGN